MDDYDQKSAEELLNEFEKLLGEAVVESSDAGFISDHWLTWKTLDFAKTLLFNTKDKHIYPINELCLGLLDENGFEYLYNELTTIVVDYFEVLRKGSKTFKVSRHELEKILGEMEDEKRSISSNLNNISGIWEASKEAGLLCSKALIKALHSQQKALNLSLNSEFKSRLDIIQETFSLQTTEVDMIIFLYLLEENKHFDDNLVNCLQMDNFSKSTPFYEFLLNSDRVTIRNILNKSGKLTKIGMLESSPRRSPGTIELSGHVTEYLTGITDRHITDIYFKRADMERRTLDLEKHHIDSKEMELIKLLLTSPGGKNILLHGEPGTGKTEFVHSLAKSLGMNLHIITSHNPESRFPGSHRKSALAAAKNLLTNDNDLILIDECDDVLNLDDDMFYSRGEKAWINTFLEESKIKIIWVSNKSSSIMSSTKRRFNYSLEFKPLCALKRLNIWENQIEDNQLELFTDEELKDYSNRFEVNAGGIALALKDLKKIMEKESDPTMLKKALEQILKRHQQFAIGSQEQLNGINRFYDPTLINTDVPALHILNKLEKYSANEAIKAVMPNFNLLFQGPSGTGKTEFAKHIAERLGKKLLVKRTSDILSKYLGDTEKMIADIFLEAEQTDSILFLDEADSLFLERKESQKQYQVQQTNEFLMQMENFKGILICATNNKDSMDGAVMRRFTSKISFDYLSKEAVVKLANLYFPEVSFTKEQEQRLSALPRLTPGDFKVVFNHSLLEEEMEADQLISALQNEVDYKKENRVKIGL